MPVDTPQPRQAQASESLTQKTARGYAYMLAQTLGAQVVNLFSFIVLGWLLFEKDFGLYALTITVGTAAALIQRIGLRTILIHRYRKFDRWANPAFWMSFTFGVASGAVMAAAAPMGEWIFRAEGLAGLIVVLAMSMPFTALCVTPEAHLQAQMRFRLLATVQFGLVAGTMILTVLFAALLDFGPYSFVVPRPIMAASRLAVLWAAAHPPIRWNPQLRRWRYMFTDVAMLLTAEISTYVTTQCDYMVLGLFHTDKVVGVYFFAFALSQRAVLLLTHNLRDVLFPALSSLQDDPHRQVAAFLRASRLLVLIGAPVCLLQAALAEPGFNALLPKRWEGAVPVLQVLSLGALFHLVGQPALSLIQAQGRFRTLVVLSVTGGLFFLTCVTTGVVLGEAKSLAVAVALYMAIIGPAQMYVAIRPSGGRWRDIWNVFALPTAVGGAAVGAAWLVGRVLPPMPGRDWVLLGLIPLGSALLYAPLVRLVQTDDWRDLMERLKGLFSTPGSTGK